MTYPYQHIYFIGIGGIGMSNLAQYFHALNVRISGYDKTSTLLTQKLEKMGMSITYSENQNNLTEDIDLVVYTPAVPKDFPFFAEFKKRNLPIIKRSDLLQIVTSKTFNVSVAGTHGKTTTSGMIAHMLSHTQEGCSAFIGGIVKNYNSNYWKKGKGEISVTEADEYDRSFLKLHPNISVVTSIQEDHLDIYGNFENILESYKDFINLTNPNGKLIINQKPYDETNIVANINPQLSYLTYSIQNNKSDIHVTKLIRHEDYFSFNVNYRGENIEDLILRNGGYYNVENALACIAVGKELQISNAIIRESIATFQGIKRRFDYILNTPEIKFIDDYAHHPEELLSCILSLKKIYPDLRLGVMFQPHLYTRTRDFSQGFAKALDYADDIILLPIYPARELPIEGVESSMIVKDMKNKNVHLLSKDEALQYVKQNKQKIDVFLTVGAGDIDLLIPDLKKILQP